MLVTKVFWNVSVPRKMYSSSYNISYSNVLSEELRVSQFVQYIPFLLWNPVEYVFHNCAWRSPALDITFHWNTKFHSSKIYLNTLFLLVITLQFLLFRFSDYINKNSLSATYSSQLHLIISYTGWPTGTWHF